MGLFAARPRRPTSTFGGVVDPYCEDCEAALAAMIPMIHDHVGEEDGDDV